MPQIVFATVGRSPAADRVIVVGGKAGPDWTDDTTPRTDKPRKFSPASVVPYGLCWGLKGRYAIIGTSKVA